MHPAVRAALNFLNIKEGMEIHHDGDLPAKSGLGSSSSFTVGILNSLYALKGRMIPKMQLAKEAIRIERDILKENVGSQDQVAAACGGFNKITFRGNDEFLVEPLVLSVQRMKELEDHLMLFFTGFARIASEIAKVQIENTPNKKDELNNMYQMVDEGVRILCGTQDILKFGELLHESWKIKRTLSDQISNQAIDDLYQKGMMSGAIGGKILGAGGGGFMLLFVPPERKQNVREALRGFLEVPFHFENSGSQIIHYNSQII